MNIQEYIDQLETTKNALISLNLPLDTPIVYPPDMGCFTEFNEPNLLFEVMDVFKAGNCRYKYAYVCGNELTETERVVVVRSRYSRY